MLSKVYLVLVAFTPTAQLGAANHNVLATTIYTVTLSGEAEPNFAHPSGVVGDIDGFGSVTLTINPGKKQLCYDFALSGLSTPLMAHIHQAPPLRNGPPVVTLFTGPGGDLDDCITWTRRQLAQIVAHPSAFYVNVGTTEYPDGALRGQLSTASRAAGNVRIASNTDVSR